MVRSNALRPLDIADETHSTRRAVTLSLHRHLRHRLHGQRSRHRQRKATGRQSVRSLSSFCLASHETTVAQLLPAIALRSRLLPLPSRHRRPRYALRSPSLGPYTRLPRRLRMGSMGSRQLVR